MISHSLCPFMFPENENLPIYSKSYYGMYFTAISAG